MKMRKHIDLRKRVGNLIKAIEDIPDRHRTPALANLLTSLQGAANEYDGEPAPRGDQ